MRSDFSARRLDFADIDAVEDRDAILGDSHLHCDSLIHRGYDTGPYSVTVMTNQG